MLTNIRIKNFKCFPSLELGCANLNLLTGINGAGKSTVMQTLLMLRQSVETRELLNGRLVLSGSLIELGTGADVLFENASEDVISIGLGTTDARFEEWEAEFEYSRTSDQLKWRYSDTSDVLRVFNEGEDIPPFGGRIVYVSADRIGPQSTYPLSEFMARRGDIGTRGEFAWNFLRWNQRVSRHESYVLSDGDPRCLADSPQSLNDAVDAWLQDVCPGAHLQISEVTEADAVVSGFFFDRPGPLQMRPFRAINVGFGLSYALPVIVALLMPQDTLCLIENPEAHLHPRGQTKLAELAARAASAGVQVFVETHSDHFIDGIRIAVRDGIIQPEDAAIHYFERRDGEAVVRSPEVDADGRLSEWPEGFFDQHEENLARLLAPRSFDA